MTKKFVHDVPPATPASNPPKEGVVARVLQVVDDGTDAVKERVKQGLKQRVDGVKQSVTWATDGIDDVRQRVDALRDAGNALLNDVRQSIDIRRQITTLQPGDRYTLQVGASGHAEGIKLYGQGQIHVRKDGATYIVTAEGDLGGGLLRELGARLGMWRAGISGELLLGAGVGVELRFATAQETHKTIELLLKLSTLSSVGRVLEGLPLSDKWIPTRFLDVFRLTEEEKSFLSSRACAYLVRGQLVVDLALALGGSGRLASMAGLIGQGLNKEQITARVELDEAGEPEHLVLITRASQQVVLGGRDGANAKASSLALVKEKANHVGALVLTQSFQIPPAWNTVRNEEGLFAALRQMAREIIQTKEDRLSIEIESIGGPARSSRLLLELAFTGEWGELLQREHISMLLQGHWEELLASAGQHLQLEASMSPFRITGLELTPGIGLMGVGVALEVHATREELLPHPQWRVTGNAGALAQQVQQTITQGMQWLKERVPNESEPHKATSGMGPSPAKS